jgi:multiple sugar transport system substrate-binding protein
MAEEAEETVCGLSSCALVCPANVTDFQSQYNCEESARNEGVITLKFLTGEFGKWLESTAQRFSAERPDVNVEVVVVPMSELSPNIVNEATSKTGLLDGFITPPGVMGSIVEEDGWADLKPFIEESTTNTKDWSDILLSYRKWISQYQDRILMFPLDGDVLSLFYRKDALEAFDLGVPRTWDEYNEVAAALHGKVFKNNTLVGSCIGRVKGCAGAYWANLVLSSMTQTSGTSSGHLFDTRDMKPLLGEALIKALELMEGQAQYGADGEFYDCVRINDQINDGTCAMTYNWGNTFVVHQNERSVFADPSFELGVARTPGSTMVLDRTTMKLVPCDSERCPFGTYYEDIGIVNEAPYLAFGGWYVYNTRGTAVCSLTFRQPYGRIDVSHSSNTCFFVSLFVCVLL